MREMIAPLGWAHMDAVLDHIGQWLAAGECPVILQIRTKLVAEELLSALICAEGGQTARVRCTCPAPQQILLQYGNEAGPLDPDLSVLESLLRNACTNGVKAEFEAGTCVITVEKP